MQKKKVVIKKRIPEKKVTQKNKNRMASRPAIKKRIPPKYTRKDNNIKIMYAVTNHKANEKNGKKALIVWSKLTGTWRIVNITKIETV